MAIFHLNAKVISRGKGQSAIAAAAYRSGEPLHDQQTGEAKLYQGRAGRVLFTDIMAPKTAPEWVHDRNALWNAAERAEKRKDAQLAREIEISLPHELTAEQRIWLVKDFAREQFVRRGYAVDLAIHAPDRGDPRNHHAHLMVTRRTLGPDGFAPTKDWQFDPQQLAGWREQWAALANRHLERYGHTARIDHRSLEAQGIDREATTHVGYAAQEMAARGAQSDRMDVLQGVQERNGLRTRLRTTDAELAQLRELAANENRKLRSASGRARESRAMPDGPTDDELKQQPGREKEYLNHLQARHERAQAALTEQRRAQELDQRAISYLQAKEIEAEDGRRKKAEQEAAETRHDRNGDIGSASARYSVALGQTYDVRDPYVSLGRAAGAEAAMFHKTQEQLRADAAKETDPDKRQAIDLRRQIEGCEYMAITNERLAGISTVVTGNPNNDYAVKDRQQAAQYRAMAEGLREQRSAVLEKVQARADAEIAHDQRGKPSLEPRARADAAPPYRQAMPAAAPEPVSADKAASPREPSMASPPAPEVRAAGERSGQSRTGTRAEPAPEAAKTSEPARSETLRPSPAIATASFEAVPMRTSTVTMPKEAAAAQSAQVSATAPFGPQPHDRPSQPTPASPVPEARTTAQQKPSYRQEMPATAPELRVIEKDGKDAGTLSSFLQREQPKAAEPYRPPSMGVLLGDKAAYKRHQLAQLHEMETARNADKALDRIGGDLTKGSKVQADDLRSLTREQWDSARTKGEDGLRQSVREAKDRGNDGQSRGGSGPPKRKDP